jgi:hypothetical protein
MNSPRSSRLYRIISRFSAGGPLDLLAEFTIRSGAVILAPGGPAMLTAEAQRKDLPDDFRHDAIVVRNGHDIRQALTTFWHRTPPSAG